jgi:rubrerythrin
VAVLSGSELVEVALGIERNGIAYYGALAESTIDAPLKGTFRDLAGMERKHIEIFQKMLTSVGKYQLPYGPESEQEYELYLKALVDSAVFADDKVALQMARSSASPAEAIQTAMGAEKDSILFYNEMRDLVPQRERPIVDGIINEEKSHLRQLSSLKKKLAYKGE